MLRLVGTWQVTAVSGVDIPDEDRHRPWLTFDGDGQVYGMSGVNRVRGTFSVSGDTITFGPLASTMMAGPDAAMHVEQRLQALLAEALTLDAGATAAAVRADAGTDAGDTDPGDDAAGATTDHVTANDHVTTDHVTAVQVDPPPGRLVLTIADGSQITLVRTIALD